MDIVDFKASNGWIESFRKRHGISFNVISGESASVPENVCDDWKEKLLELISGYEQKDVYNMDETGVFYRALPVPSIMSGDARVILNPNNKYDYTWIITSLLI